MFNGVPDQFHQFGPSPLPFPLSFPFHHGGTNISPPTSAATNNFPPVSCFDLYHHPTTLVQNHVLQLQQQQSSCTIRKEKEEAIGTSDDNDNDDDILSTNMVVVGVEETHHERSISDQYQWSNDEVLALLKIRSGLENWFSEFTWDHVSRKLAELGYQRSGEKCKEKFEEESSQFNDMSCFNNYRFFGEQNELYHTEIPHPNGEGEEKQQDEKKTKNCDDDLEADIAAGKLHEVVDKKRKRKRTDDEEFEIFMGFCASVVKRLITKQEEMHNKLIQDIVKREEDSIAREEAWRNQEIIKIKKDIELRAQEKAIADEKQAKVIDLLKKFIPSFDSLEDQNLLKKIEHLFSTIKNSTHIEGSQHGTITCSKNTEEEEVRDIVPFVSGEDKDGTGKRWPRDEVLALINIRCKLNNNNINQVDKEELAAAAKQGPLWERISKGMMEMGYKRSSKRCKEKWENINKYFRKTKDNKKKRSQDSRTCPYFQQLNTLYSSQGTTTTTLLTHSDAPPENC